VVPASARYREGLDQVLQAVSEVATGQFVCKPRRIQNEPFELKRAVTDLTTQIASPSPDCRTPDGSRSVCWTG